MTGVVFSWNPVKRCGWIRPDEGPKDFFVHRVCLVDVTELQRGQTVTFMPTDTERGPRAMDVRVLEPVSQPEKVQAR
jgi:cold shock CspA family protein